MRRQDQATGPFQRPISPRKQDATSSDNEPAADVSDELRRDPKLDNSSIAVSGSDRGDHPA
jgi:hypothetical protein